MDIETLHSTKPIKPSINEDGWYTQCSRCWEEIKPVTKNCPNCGQAQDWAWLMKDVGYEK